MRSAAFALALAVFTLEAAFAEPTPWNGHWYEPVVRPGGISWSDAQAEAAGRGGYLATVTSNEENLFVFGLANSIPEIWSTAANNTGQRGPWLGGFQSAGISDPWSGWQWVSGEPWAYTNWYGAGIEPNGIGEQDFLQYRGDSASPRSAAWNDTTGGPAYEPVLGSMVEFNTPEPAMISLLALAAAVLLGRRR